MVITDKEFNQLAKYIEDNYGIHLKSEKKTLVEGRLQHVLQQRKLKNFTEYYNYLISDKTNQAAVTLLNNITTNHTFFMREVDHFDFFQNQVLPFLKTTVKDKDLRIWSAGCSTGEEPYTLSMIINDYFGKEKAWWDTKVLATDISERALTRAKSGQYSNSQIMTVPQIWKDNYFEIINKDTSRIKENLRNEVIFRRLNLMDGIFPFKRKFHVIFCRNVMIYFNDKLKSELVNRFYEYTEPGGYLFIGHSESINREATGYKYISPAIYRKM